MFDEYEKTDGAMNRKGWKNLLREFQGRSGRLRFRTTRGQTEILEMSDEPRVKASEINEALEELYKSTPKDTMTVVEINQEIEPDEEDRTVQRPHSHA